MPDIKMSEKFSLVTYREKTSSILNGDESIALLTGDHEIGRTIVHAISNHDHLTQENAKLKADNSELVEALESTLWLTKMSESNFLKIEKLIQKHKEV